MPKQINNPLDESRVALQKMTFTPDVPSNALGPNEYNLGANVETDIRGIRSMAGDKLILETVPSTPIYISSGFRRNGEYWFVVACENGRWYASNGTTYSSVNWYDITPTTGPFSGYTQSTNITEGWNGTVAFFNDSLNPPMFWPDEDASTVAIPAVKLTPYSNQVPLNVSNITATTVTTKTVVFSTTQATAPFVAGAYVILSGVTPNAYNGTWQVVSCSTASVVITCNVTVGYQTGGIVSPLYSWNNNPNWKSLTAGFMRVYNTPNVGTILVAGNLTAVNATTNAIETYPVTVNNSQAIGLNQAPLTWTTTAVNVANSLEIPLRGPALDAFPCQGQLFVCSYWDTVVFSPLNYTTTSAPILGVRLFNQGRGLLSANCSVNTDKMIYGIDARDIWVFNGQEFQGLGNQRVKNWFFDQIDPQYYNRIHMQVNTQRNQIEIYFPDRTATSGAPNKMLSYRYDLDIWNSPRDVTKVTFATESPIFTYNATASKWEPNNASRTIVYAQASASSKIVMKDQGFTTSTGGAITSYFTRDNLKLLPDYSGKVMIHRLLPEAVNLGAEPFSGDDERQIVPSTGSIEITVTGANSVGSSPSSSTAITMNLNTDNPWAQINQNAFRVNSVKIGNTSSTNVWSCNAITFQYMAVEDDR
jgi:hypothetical protein